MKIWIKYGFAVEFDTARIMKRSFTTSKKCVSTFIHQFPFFEIEFTTKIKEKNLHLCLHFFFFEKSLAL